MIDGVDRMFDLLSDCTALTIAPKIALPAAEGEPPRPPVAPSTDLTAASCSASATGELWVVVTTSPLTVVVVVRSRSRRDRAGDGQQVGLALE